MDPESQDDVETREQKPSGPADDPGRRRPPRLFWMGLFLLAGLLGLQLLFGSKGSDVAYTELLQLMRGDHVAEIHVDGDVAEVKLREGHEPDRPRTFQVVLPPPEQIRELLALVEEKHIKAVWKVENPLQTIFVNLVIPIALIALFWIFFLRRFNPAAESMRFGQTRAKMYAESDVKTTFDDVAGVEEAVEEVREVVDFLKRPEKYRAIGATIPKGILLIGLPGTGKTLLARAIAGEAKVPFFSISGSDFMELFVGVGAARVRDLFQRAQASAPCIVFIDELDVLGKTRAGFPNQGEQEQTLNQLLVELDGFQPNSGVIFLAATNRPELLDAALLRAGRFDRHVIVDRPDRKGREAILKVHARTKRIAEEDVDLSVVARRTVGMVGADLANLLNEAALLAARRGDDRVRMIHIEEAIDRVTAGLEKKRRVLTDEERRTVAVHEAGHAVVAWRTKGADPVHKISVVPRGMAALGFTVQTPASDRYLLRTSEIEGRLAVLLGGRVAEELVFGEITTGAQNDLRQATDFARRMVMEFGMSDRMGLSSFPRDGMPPLGRYRFQPADHEREWSDETAREMDLEVKRILGEARDRARTLIERDRPGLEALSERLLATEELDRDEIEAILGEPATKVSQEA